MSKLTQSFCPIISDQVITQITYNDQSKYNILDYSLQDIISLSYRVFLHVFMSVSIETNHDQYHHNGGRKSRNNRY